MNNNAQQIVIAIDGPAGAGKSTIARRLATELGYIHLNSGALYRGATLLALRGGVALDDERAISALVRAATMDFTSEGRFLLNGEDVSEEIRTAKVTEAVSKVSVLKAVRQAVTGHQRRIASRANVVAEGRDMTTVVFPDAAVKVYLNASIEERARRRYEELRQNGVPVSLDEIQSAIARRDHEDSTRAESPLLVAEDAIVVDTTGLSIEQVVASLLRIAKASSPACSP